MMGTKIARFGLETLESQTTAFIAEIKTLDDEKLIERYRQTLKLGDIVWRMECACAAEMMDRAMRKRGGRGQIDEGEEGRKAVAKKWAAQIGVAPRTVEVAAEIHKKFFDPETSAGACASLADVAGLSKNYFHLAVDTPDPWVTIKRFAVAKVENPDFSVRDAKRLIADNQAPPLDDVIWGGMDEQKRAIWSEYQRAASGMKYHFPAVRLMLAEHLDDLKESLKALSSTTIRGAILKLIQDGLSTKEEITAALGKPREYVSIWLDRMVIAGDLSKTEKERAEGARGAATALYFAKNKPSPRV